VSHEHQVVIIGGGFGGLYAALACADPLLDVTLIDRRNFHLFQPLLYQVATGALSPADVAAPLRVVLKRQRNVEVLLAEVTDLDVENRRVLFEGGAIPYQSLILATGSRHHYFGQEGWEPLAPGLKTVEEATEIRRRILLAFERAELEVDPGKRRALLTFVIVGGGPTGVELAGAIAELARDTLRGEFSKIDPAEARILLIEGEERVIPSYPPALSARAARSLGELGVTVRSRCRVTGLSEGLVEVRTPEGEEQVQTRTILWAAGVQASPLGQVLQNRAGASLDRAGRVVVGPDLSLPGHPEIFVIGDLASFVQDGKPLPALASVAIQEGRYAGQTIRRRLLGEPVELFRFHDRGDLATIGRSKAVARLGRFGFGGFFAWLLWVFVHLMNLVRFESRVLVLIQWAWSYFTRNRNARLITGEKPRP
jgi:NADH dehydrogenase